MMAEDITRINMLLLKSIAGQLSPLEEEELELWKSQSGYYQDLADRLHDPDYLIQELKTYHELDGVTVEQPVVFPVIHVRRLPGRRLRWVAAASTLFMAIVSLIYLFFIRDTKVDTNSKGPALAAMQPAKNRAILSVDGAGSYTLDSIPAGAMVAGAKKTADGTLVFDAPLPGGKETSHLLKTPAGGFYAVSLWDGSRVWVNAASELRFTTGQRSVSLKGEAYFEISHWKDVPFSVKTASGTITVLGTHFNIKNYPEEKMVTSLLEGVIEVTAGNRTQQLKPGEQSTIDRETGSMKVAPGDVESAAGWRKGVFAFGGASLQEVLREISRWYNVKVEYKPGIQSTAELAGDFDRSLNLDELLKQLEIVAKVKFHIAGNSIIVEP